MIISNWSRPVEATARRNGCRSMVEGYRATDSTRRCRGEQGRHPIRRDRDQHPAGLERGANRRRQSHSALRNSAQVRLAPTGSSSMPPRIRHRLRRQSRGGRRSTPADSPVSPASAMRRVSGAVVAAGIPSLSYCSRACSSVPPARRRASTRPGTTGLYDCEIRGWPCAAAGI